MKKTEKLLQVILLAVFVMVIAYVAPDYFPASIEEVTPGPTDVFVPTQYVSGKLYFNAYFTNPPTDINTAGIEENLITLIDNAKVSVHGALYELDLLDLTNSLINATRRGVDVKLVYDDGQMDDPERIKILSELKKAGITLVPDNRSAFMHNKFFVIDGKIVWTGSFNFTQNASHKNNENAVVFYIPQLTQNYEKEFSEMFSGQFGARSPADTPYPEIVFDGVSVRNYFSPEDSVMEKIIAAVGKAEYSIYFLSFSFTDVNLAYTMSEMALENDIVVRGVFESNQNMGYSVCPYLLLRSKNIEGNGEIDVRLDANPATMHEKIIVIDNRIVIFGSFNFSENADTKNDENLLIIDDPDLANMFTLEFNKIFNQGIIPTSGCKKQ